MARKKSKIILLILLTIFSSLFSQANDATEKLNKIYSIYEKFSTDFKNVKSITIEELVQKKSEYILLDARSDEESKVSTIEGSIMISEFEKNIDKYKNSKIVVFCTVGYRSGQYAEQLVAKGFNVLNLKGGILSWVLSGNKIYHDNKEVFDLHVYSKKWNMVPTGIKAIW